MFSILILPPREHEHVLETLPSAFVTEWRSRTHTASFCVTIRQKAGRCLARVGQGFIHTLPWLRMLELCNDIKLRLPQHRNLCIIPFLRVPLTIASYGTDQRTGRPKHVHLGHSADLADTTRVKRREIVVSIRRSFVLAVPHNQRRAKHLVLATMPGSQPIAYQQQL
jgi:hypothetical protein